ncbi:MAG: protein translocase subunit SecD, partial [Patescibacteria group bacterium]
LDGQPISTPRINEAITDGKAQISGDFTAEAGRDLARNLNYGALPLPISLLNTQKVGPTLGQATLVSGIWAGIIGFFFIVLFLIVWYRIPGLIASLTLIFYLFILLALFKLVPVTITSAGIAALILSLGMAVDSNILVFARIKEEMKKGRSVKDAVEEGFSRAWFSIRDSNISGILSSIILFWFGTALVKGFALTLILGVLVSMITAITITRTFLRAVAPRKDSALSRFLFSSGLSK